MTHRTAGTLLQGQSVNPPSLRSFGILETPHRKPENSIVADLAEVWIEVVHASAIAAAAGWRRTPPAAADTGVYEVAIHQAGAARKRRKPKVIRAVATVSPS